MAQLTALAVATGILAVSAWSEGMAAEKVRFGASSTYVGKRVVLAGELFRPKAAGRYPAVVLMHGCGGWQPSVHRSLRTHARYLVRHGFVVLSLDSFGPRGNSGGWVCKTLPRLSGARAYRTVDAFDALKYLQTLAFVDSRNIFLMGQSNGGSVAIRAALASGLKKAGTKVFRSSPPRFRAAAAYYPWCGAFGPTARPRLASPVVVFGGGRDDWVPPAPCKSITPTGAKFELKIYPSAAHSFDLDIPLTTYLGHLVGRDRQATTHSRRGMVAFFRRYLAK